MNRDEERLQKLYDEKSDDVLLDMWSNRDDLTETAQAALQSVMHSCNLNTADEPLPTAEPAQSAAEAEVNAVFLCSFGDMFQARQAVDLLDDAQLAYKLVDLSQGVDITTWGSQSAMIQVFVADYDYAAAVKVLHDSMGLFPKSELDAPEANIGPLDDLQSVLMLDAETELQEGIAASRALAENGISFFWHDGRDFPQGLPDAHTLSIEVRAAAHKKAAAVVEACLDALPQR